MDKHLVALHFYQVIQAALKSDGIDVVYVTIDKKGNLIADLENPK